MFTQTTPGLFIEKGRVLVCKAGHYTADQPGRCTAEEYGSVQNNFYSLHPADLRFKGDFKKERKNHHEIVLIQADWQQFFRLVCFG